MIHRRIICLFENVFLFSHLNVLSVSAALSRTHNKNVQLCKLVSRRNLQSKQSARQTILVQLESEDNISYQPGDHVAIFAENDPQDVTALLDRLGIRANQAPIQVEVLVEKASGMGN